MSRERSSRNTHAILVLEIAYWREGGQQVHQNDRSAGVGVEPSRLPLRIGKAGPQTRQKGSDKGPRKTPGSPGRATTPCYGK